MSKSSINTYIDGQAPDNNTQQIKPINLRNIAKRLNNEGYNLADNDSDDINEGTSNLFLTDQRVSDIIAQVIQDSADSAITWAYNPGSQTLTPTISGGSGGGIEITEASFPGVIAKITNNANYSDAYGNANAAIGGYWNGVTAVPAGPSEHDYYIEPIASPNGFPRHVVTFLYVSGVLKPSRVPYLQ